MSGLVQVCLLALALLTTHSAYSLAHATVSKRTDLGFLVSRLRPRSEYEAYHGKPNSANSANRKPNGNAVAPQTSTVEPGRKGYSLWGNYASDTYRAAVVEFKVNSTFLLIPDVTQATERMMSNVRGFETVIKAAKLKGVQIIVFPEDGIIGGGFLTRDQLLFFMEQVPEVEGSKPINPCTDEGFEDRPVLKKLSCLARQYEIVVVANMGDKQPCHSSPNRTCPPNGWYQFNTNVAFETDGTLVAKYHKKHLFGPEKLLFDASNSTGCVSFSTSFGPTFGTFTCYDILYPDPADCLLRTGIQHFIFPTAWGSVYPYYMSIAVQQSWSLKHKVNLLAANQHYPHSVFDFYSTGSGLYAGGVAPDYYISGEEFEVTTGQMIIADLPVDPSKPHSHAQSGNRSNVGNVGASVDAHPKFAILTTSNGSVSITYNSTDLGRELVCTVDYEMERSTGTDTYAIGAFIGASIKDSTFTYAVCTLCKCPTSSVESCGQPVDKHETSTVFKQVRVSGSFSKGSEVLVNLLGSGLQLVDPSLVQQRGEGDFAVKGLSLPLLSFSLWSGVFK